MKPRLSKGQTLLEVVFVMVLITVALSAFVFTATRSVRSTTATTTRSIATKYAQEGLEMVRQLRDRNWSNFVSYGNPPSVRCPTSDTVSIWSEGACSVSGEYSGIYERSADFSWDNATERMAVTIHVSWEDESGLHDSTLASYFVRL